MNQGNNKVTLVKILKSHQPQTKVEEAKALKTIKQMKMDQAYQAARLASLSQRHKLDEELCESL